MAKVNYTVCDRCEAKSTQDGVKIGMFSFDQKMLDLCLHCQEELKALFNHSIHARLLAGAKALEDLAEEVGDDRAAELCGCSSSHLAESLREIEENIGGDV